MHSNQQSQRVAAAIRRKVVEMTSVSGASHVGSCLSIADILAVLYVDVLNFDAGNPDWSERDRFILSKGHAAAALYATLSEVDILTDEELKTHCGDGSRLMGHASHHLPGVEFSTGSLGHGLPVAGGMALADKLDNNPRKMYALLSDGECDEGSNWEAIMFAGFHNLGNLTAIVDYNKIQSLKSTKETLDLEPFTDKWVAFGWNVIEVDGHDHDALRKAFREILKEDQKPNVIICHTTKGKGVSFMEDSVLWHYRSPKGDEFEAAMSELESGVIADA